MSLTPFSIDVDQQTLARIARQVADYRWPKTPAGASWEYGTDPETLRFVVGRWRDIFDWKREESRLNSFPQFKAPVDGLGLHFVHLRAIGGSRPPMVLLHGWPSSYLEYLDVARRLAEGAGGRDVVLVSLPGYGYSDAPERPIGPRGISTLVHRLLTDILGYKRYIAHGSDWGSLIAGWLGFDQPEHCAGIHMTMLSPRFIAGGAKDPHEQTWLAGFRERFEDDGAYFRLQTSRPLTAGFVLADNPVGLLAWMLEKFAAWGDPGAGEKSLLFQTPERADRVLRNVMLYLVTDSAATSTWIYRGITTEGPPGYPGGKRVEVPVAIAATQDPVFVPPPRSLVEKAYRVVRWTPYPHGGHFPADDVPELLVDDLAAFADGL